MLAWQFYHQLTQIYCQSFYFFLKLSWTTLPLSNSNLNTTSVITQLRQFSFLFLKLWNHDEWSPKNPCLGIWTPVHSNFKMYVTLWKTVVTYSLAKLSFLLSLLRKQLQLFKDSQKRYKIWKTDQWFMNPINHFGTKQKECLDYLGYSVNSSWENIQVYRKNKT